MAFLSTKNNNINNLKFQPADNINCKAFPFVGDANRDSNYLNETCDSFVATVGSQVVREKKKKKKINLVRF